MAKKKKPMSDAERTRRRRERIKSDPVLREAYLAKKRQKAKEAYVKVKDRPEREQRILRKKWRAKYKAKKAKAAMVKSAPESTPPTAPEALIDSEQAGSSKEPSNTSLARVAGKKRRSEIIMSLKRQVLYYKKRWEVYRKRLRRSGPKSTKGQDEVLMTPRSEVRRVLRREYGRSPKIKEVRRTLFGQAVVADAVRKSSHKMVMPSLRKYALARKDGWKCAMSQYLGRDGSHRLRSGLGGDIHKKLKRQSRHEQVMIGGVKPFFDAEVGGPWDRYFLAI